MRDAIKQRLPSLVALAAMLELWLSTKARRRTSTLRRVGWPLAAAVMVAFSGRASASAQLSFADLQHSTWTLNQGAPPYITAIAQTPDGYLWLGSQTGLYRFDGISFQAIGDSSSDQPHTDSVLSLLVTQAGEVLVGYRHGAPAILQDGVLKPFAVDHFGTDVLQMVQDRSGAIWMRRPESGRELVRYAAGKFDIIGADWGLQSGAIHRLLLSKSGVLWLIGETTVQFLAPGSRRFEQVAHNTDGSAPALFEEKDGRVWIVDWHGARPLPDHLEGSTATKQPQAPEDAGQRPFEALVTNDGAFWGSDGTHGVFRFYPADVASLPVTRPMMQSFGVKDGLTSNFASSFFQDKEGNVWVGTLDGLDQFRPKPIRLENEFFAPVGSFFSTAVDDEGSVYVSSMDATFRIPPGGQPQPIMPEVHEAYDICKANEGGLWVFTEQRVIKWQKGSEHTYPASGADMATLSGCAEDKNGHLWITDDHIGLQEMSGGRWNHIELTDLHAVPGRVGNIEPDSQGGVNFLLSSIGIINIRNHVSKVLSSFRDLGIGTVAGLSQHGPDLLVSGQFGLSRIRNGVTRSLRSDQYSWMRGTNGFIETKRGEAWIVSLAGIFCLSTAELNASFDAPGRSLRPRQFDNTEGLPSWTNTFGSEHVAVEAGDGRIWIDAGEHIISINAEHLPHNPLPPPVSITSMSADGRQYVADGKTRLPPGTANLQFTYTALSLTIPTHVRFKYRLQPYDETWTDVGARREAYYTNLPPAHYRFQVIAANNDGVWNTQGASIDFTIPPTFLQSWYFLALCAIAVAVSLWVVYSIRMRQLTNRVRDRLEHRISERERIARELHDTLLQGFQGLLLRFQAVADTIPSDHGARLKMDKALDVAEAVLCEGRDRVKDLRNAPSPGGLAQALSLAAARLVAEPALACVHETGRIRPLHAVVREEACRIGEEAIANATRHAGATLIEINIGYAAHQLTLSIVDNGQGFDPVLLRLGQRAGHFGLVGMRERAKQIKGEVCICNSPGGGAQVSLIIPSLVAYSDPSGGNWIGALRRLTVLGRLRP